MMSAVRRLPTRLHRKTMWFFRCSTLRQHCSAGRLHIGCSKLPEPSHAVITQLDASCRESPTALVARCLAGALFQLRTTSLARQATATLPNMSNEHDFTTSNNDVCMLAKLHVPSSCFQNGGGNYHRARILQFTVEWARVVSDASEYSSIAIDS